MRECRMSGGLLESSPEACQARVVDLSRPEKESFRGLRKLECVAWAYAHRIENGGWESDLAHLCDSDSRGASHYVGSLFFRA